MTIPKIILQHLQNNRPYMWGLFSGNFELHKVFSKTLDTIFSPVHRKKLYIEAENNLQRWQATKQSTPGVVEVVPDDWGTAVGKFTAQFGKTYAVLNNANSAFPGGGVFEQRTAQEENMFLRTTLGLMFADEHAVYFDEKLKTFCYQPWMSELINSCEMTEGERGLLARLPELGNHPARKVFFNPQQQVLFRDQEYFKEADAQEFRAKGNFVTDCASSFNFLPQNHYTPFYELRSAAPDLSHQHVNSGNNAQANYLRIITERIQAQLDTLIINQQRHVVLSAWGCGCFNNNPEIIAETYAREIDKRREHFDHIIFAIRSPMLSEHRNFTSFNSILGKNQLTLHTPPPENRPSSLRL